jgi:BASS family bile acid:Na+ symporter
LVPVAIGISIFLLVLAIGLDATLRDATHLLRHPGQLVRSLAAMYLVMPALAVGIALAFDLPPAVEIVLVAMAMSPVPPFLPRKAIGAGGARDYTIGLLVAASALAVVLVPLGVELLGRVFGKHYAMPTATVARVVILTALAPLAAGMAIRHFAPALAERTVRPVSTASIALLVLALVPVLLAAWQPTLSMIRDGTTLALSGFVGVGALVGHLLGGPRLDERGVLALACGTRHPGIALAIAHANFPGNRNVLPVVLLYLVVGAVVSALYLRWLGR